MQSLVQIFLEQIQILEDLNEAVLILTELEHAEGAQLDQIGRIVDFPRFTLDDALYKKGISAKILANRSDGSTDFLVGVVAAILGTSPLKFKLRDLGHASIELFLYGNVAEDLMLLIERLVAITRCAGVDCRIRWREVDCLAKAFAWSPTYGSTGHNPQQGLGYASVSHTDAGLLHGRQA